MISSGGILVNIQSTWALLKNIYRHLFMQRKIKYHHIKIITVINDFFYEISKKNFNFRL